MKNDKNPLIMALRRPSSDKESIRLPEPPRMLEVTSQELPTLRRLRPGDPLKLAISARLKSMNDNGRSMIEVDHVEYANPEEHREEAKEAKILMTQESHSPGGA